MTDKEEKKKVATTTTTTNEPKVVSFMSEKEERKISEGKVYADRARAKKRERKERYKARKAEEKQQLMSNEEAATQMLRELGAEHGSGTIDSIVGGTFLDNAIPEEFRAEFDAIVDTYGPEVDVPDMARPRHAASTAQPERRHARPGPGASVNRRAKEAEKDAEDEDVSDGGDAADNEDDVSNAGDRMCQGAAFGAALQGILRPAAKAAAAGATKLAGEESATKRIRQERAAMREAAEKSRLKKMIINKACVLPDMAQQDGERRLRILATRGVVRLFNAISQHQAKVAKEGSSGSGGGFEQQGHQEKMKRRHGDNNEESESDGDEPKAKRGKGITPLTNEDFLSLLRKNSTTGSAMAGYMLPRALTESKVDTAAIERKVKEEEEEEEEAAAAGKGGRKQGKQPVVKKGVKWGALKDDFMLGAKLRDWKTKEEEDNSDDDN